MNRKKVIYISIVLILTVILSITYFSYAFFTRQDIQSGKLNIVTGTLTYKITSSDLNSNNSITLSAKEKKKINIKLISLNNINSKYILYYQTTNSNFNIGYSSTTVDQTSGTINANATKNITISLKNNNSSSITLTFGVVGGFASNDLVLDTGIAINTQFDYSTCNYNINYVWDFPFDPDGDGNGQVQNFTVPCDGNYKLEVAGAKGGKGISRDPIGGNGGYVSGNKSFKADTQLNVVVGGMGGAGRNTGYNGGGAGSSSSGAYSGAGGGATHIAIKSENYSLLSSYGNASNASNYVLIVAGGGGGGGETEVGGAGCSSASGPFGQGASSSLGSFAEGTPYHGGGGGAGWNGGTATAARSVAPGYGGAGGSCYTNELASVITTIGLNAGYGYAKITYLGE